MRTFTAILIVAILLTTRLGWCDDGLQIPPAPDWARHLVIYEVATKAFTSPNGPESGTFKSLKERVPYLAKLGINGVWLAGWNLASNDHFFGVWTQYATIDPSKLDPSLGTEQDFKDLISELHRYGIKIFLDSTEHGLTNDSPIVKKHPEWFHGGTWGMTNFDWKNKNGPHPDLDKWWVGYWMRWITEFHIDGARLDLAMGKPAVWAGIKRQAAAAGHPIVVFHEHVNWPDPVSDFSQREIWLLRRLAGPDDLDPFRQYRLGSVSHWIDIAKQFDPGVKDKEIQSIQLSCHDNYSYSAEGSPCYFGYYLFAPANFIFMSGEEFDATFKPLPRLRPDLYGKQPPGPQSVWLYGSWIQWDQLKEGKHARMLDAVTRLMEIRKQESDLVFACGRGVVANIADINVQLKGANADAPTLASVAKPYVLWNDHHAFVVGGDTDPDRSLNFRWNVPVDKFHWETAKYKVSDLWGSRAERIMSAADLAHMDLTIGPDGSPHGGLALFEIQPVGSN